MRYRKDAKGRIILKHKDGNEVAFHFAVDANEALVSVDENGEHNYTCPKSSIISATEEMRENISKRIVEKKKQKENLKRRPIRTTMGKNISDDFLVDEDEENAIDENFVQSDTRDDIGEDDKVLDEMGFKDPDDEVDNDVPKKDTPKTRGRKPSVKK